MTKISAQIIADSKNEFGNRITTMVVTFPRFILAELNTHRMMSKNSASSRAIPFEKMLKSVEENPFVPIAWQKDHKGMQGTEYFTHEMDIKTCENNWNTAKSRAIKSAISMAEHGVTKQLCNRLLEPFMWHTVILTFTEIENFFALRCPQYQMLDERRFRSIKDAIKSGYNMSDDVIGNLKLNLGQAEIHMMALAEAIWDAYNESTPKELKAGEWHIPFGDGIDTTDMSFTNEAIRLETGGHAYCNEEQAKPSYDLVRIKIATARCARVSYTVVGEEGKEPNFNNDIKLHDTLMKAGHMSPFEHCAQAMGHDENGFLRNEKNNSWWSGNFKGFIQYRKTLPNENIIKKV